MDDTIIKDITEKMSKIGGTGCGGRSNNTVNRTNRKGNLGKSFGIGK